MTKDGEFDSNSSSINYWSKILFGGLIKNMMENYGIWTTIELTWFKLWEEFKEFYSILCSRELTSQLGKVFSGKKPQDLKSQWSSKSLLTHKDQVWIKYPTEDSLFGGHQLLTELTFTLASKFNSIWQASSCTEKYQLSKYPWFKFLELTYGKKFMKVLWWIYVKFTTWNSKDWR